MEVYKNQVSWHIWGFLRRNGDLVGGIKWSSEESAWDAMATCFFLDTAKNVSLGFLELESLSPVIMVFRGKGVSSLWGTITYPTKREKENHRLKSAKRKGICDRSLEGISNITLPETNIAPTRKLTQKETIVFQPSIFRCYVSFREGKFSFIFR